MNIYLIIGVIILVIAIAIILSWPTIKPMAINYISGKIMDHVKIETPPAEMQLSECGTYGTIKYTYLNQDYTLYVPFEKKLLRKVGVSVYHVSSEGKEHEITQQPGIPILITANALGGGSIVIKKDDEVIDTYKENQIVKI